MTPLHRVIVDLVRREGPIGIDRYMALSLGHPAHGYYTSRDPFGARGDFTTAPEISQMFGELAGVWIASAWLAMGSPPRVNIVEFGPGRGALMKDALRAMKAAPGLLDAARIHLVEISPALRERQRQALEGAAAATAWHEDFANVPGGPAITVANEFFDALPIKQFEKGADGWRERLIEADEQGALRFALAPDAASDIVADAPAGAILERALAARKLAGDIAARLVRDGGAALFVDYGYSGPAVGDTLQAMRAHAFADVLDRPGENDLTAHVDFTALADAARGAGARVQGPATQADFLGAMGILARADALKKNATPDQANDIALALARLTDMRATGMGALFKVLALRAPDLPPMPGFNEETP